MILPSKEVMLGVRNLIGEITGFEDNEENFYICEQYCLSHIMHHTYPSVNKNEVKKKIDGYVHRFYIHGYFKVADGLDEAVKKFLSSDTLFSKNPESDIQWVLLSLLTNLASNLSAVSKLPKMIPVAEEEKPVEEINWGEYLKKDLPNYEYHNSDDDTSSDLSFYSQNSDSYVECDNNKEEVESEKKVNDKDVHEQNNNTTSNDAYKIPFITTRQHIIDELVKRREEEISYTRDVVMRGNFIQELGFFMNTRMAYSASQILSEYELVGYVLQQFLTGENVLKRKGIIRPATCSLTENTVKSYLASLQPYVNMVTVFKEFSNQVAYFETKCNEQFERTNRGMQINFGPKTQHHNEAESKFVHMYSNINKMDVNKKKTVPNVVKLYNLGLLEALNSFETKILTMAEYQNSYTLVQVVNELRPSFNDLSSLFSVHVSATANWLNEPNWLCSIRIIMTLYKALLHSTSNKMGFLYMNLFLYCFQAYLDITDTWISCLKLHDPHDEYIIHRIEDCDDNGVKSFSYSVRPYSEELSRVGLQEMQILDYLANKMIHVGHSIDVLNRLDRSLIKDQNYTKSGMSHESLYKALLKNVRRELIKIQEAVTISLDECKEMSVYARAMSSDPALLTDKFDERSINTILSDGINNGSTNTNFGKSSRESSLKNTISIESEIMSKDIALSEFCTKMCQNDKDDLIEKSIWPLEVVMDASVKNIVTARVINTCDVAKDVVVNEFQLKTHLRLLRNIFLFNDPHLIQPFMLALFNQEATWQNCYVLTVRLKECIETRYRDQAQYLSVSVDDKGKNPPRNILEAIDRITINYQVQWPLQIIFTPHIMSLYNGIFRHLFKLHWAHETLCKLQFAHQDEKTPEIVKSSYRRLELLRFWCLSSLGRLRSYFMAQISTPFDLELNNYQHLKDMLKAHEDFIMKIHGRCLLGESHAEGKELIFDVLLPLCNDVYEFWSRGRVIPDVKLTFTENLFFRSQKLFPRLMTGLEEE